VAIKLFSAEIFGLEAGFIEVEVDFTPGLFSFSIVGLPDKAVEEAIERVSLAVKNINAKSPQKYRARFTVNLAPADIRKEGTRYDLPIAIGFLLISKQMKMIDLSDKIFIGELSLDGKLRKVKGALPTAILAKKKGKILVLPKENQPEVEIVEGLKILPAENLREAIQKLESKKGIVETKGKIERGKEKVFKIDFAYIKAQERAKRALEIAAAGGHNLYLLGPPGSGKTLLSRAFPSILPSMTKKEILEVTAIYSVAGLLNKDFPLVSTRPFRAPHHNTSMSALIGGGAKIKPGEVTLAHRGVLFLDEFPEFRKDVIEALRQPMEDGIVQISRAKETVVFPAKFTLIAASNPCPCGFLNDENRECKCTPSQILRYQRKISGAILDRIDMKIKTSSLKFGEISSEKLEESSEEIRKRVEKARKIQIERGILNSEMNFSQIKKYCHIDISMKDLLSRAMERLSLTSRSYHKILKIARTIADLEGKEKIKKEHLAEAISYQEEFFV